MDRALRSNPASCSCSGRENLQASTQAYPFLKGRNIAPVTYRRCVGVVSHHAGWRRAHASHARSRQRGTPNDNSKESSPQIDGRIISSLVTYGLSGTLAVLGAALARIDLFGQFRWLSTSDLLFGLASASGLMALEAVLLAPPYARLLAGAGRPGAKAGAVGLQLRTERVSELLSADSLAAMLVLQQACLVAARVVRRPGLTRNSPLLEGGLVMLREVSKELLQRGLIFTFLAAWLTDRLFEAGASDTLFLSVLPGFFLIGSDGGGGGGAAMGVEVYLTDAVRYVTGLLVTASLVRLLVNEAEAMRVGVASNLALVEVEQRQQADVEEQRRRRQERQVPDQVDDNPYEEDLDSKETEAMLQEYRLYDALGRCTTTGPPRLTYALTLLRGVLRIGAPNLTFALTGNLAASWLASVLPQLLLLVYIVRGPMVLLERSSPTLEQNSGTENDSKELIDKKGNGDAN